ncbi:flagellar hook-length control protein FliK [Thalassolituus sp.]|uniref:flagellar hook-length control protein FliK n=1 Tax=Thalassolituus sp. TaxID=2030822 RepID=UPI00351782B0
MNPSLPNSPLASLMMSLGGSIDFNSLEVSQDGASGLTDFSDLLNGMQLAAVPLDGKQPALAAMTEGEGLPLTLPPVSTSDSALSGLTDEAASAINIAATNDKEDATTDSGMADNLMVQIKTGSDISVRYVDQNETQSQRSASDADLLDNESTLVLPEGGQQVVTGATVVAGLYGNTGPVTSASVSAATVSGRASNAQPVASSLKQTQSRQVNSERDLSSTAAASMEDSLAEAEEGSETFRPVTATDADSDRSGLMEMGRETAKGLSSMVQPQASAATTAAATTTLSTAALSDAGADGLMPEEASEEFSFEENFEQTLQRQSRERLEFGQDKREWTPALGARLMTMVANDVQQARIQLDPPELGSLEIKMQIQQDQATVQVSAQSHQVKDVLDSGAQRLRDALAAEGIELSEFSVSADSGQGKSDSGSESGDGSGQGLASGESAETDELVGVNKAHTPAPDALLDTFA